MPGARGRVAQNIFERGAEIKAAPRETGRVRFRLLCSRRNGRTMESFHRDDMDTTTARELYAGMAGGAAPRILDVRNEEEFARWKIEGPHPVEALNVPYFAFLEAEDDSVAAVRRWLGGRPDPLIVVCAKGGSSELVAEILRAQGIDARNLAGGMAAWGAETVATPVQAGEMRVWQIHRFGKGCLSYVIASESDAMVVDPHGAVEDYRGFLDERRLVLRAVFDTHLHADHVSGAPALASATGAVYHASREDFDGAAFSYEPIHDGVALRFGSAVLTPLLFLSAPGHTPGSTALRAGDGLLLTGDTLFVESVGRPDLAGKAAEWGRELHRTLHRRLAAIPDDALVLPAHSGGPGEAGNDGVIGRKLGALRRASPAMRADEETFLRQILEAARPAPDAYAVIREVNLGARVVDEEARVTMELGRNECALSRRPTP